MYIIWGLLLSYCWVEKVTVRDKWEAGPELYEVALRAVDPERAQRYRSVSEFKAEWDKARKEANDG